MFCDKCGKQVGEQEKFCRYCGNPLNRGGELPGRKKPGREENYQDPGLSGEKRKSRKWILLPVLGAAAALAFFLIFFFRNGPENRMEKAAETGDYETVLAIAEEEQDKGLSKKMMKSLTDVLEDLYEDYEEGRSDSGKTLDTYERFAEIRDLSDQVNAMICLVQGDEFMKEASYEMAADSYREALEYAPELEEAEEGLEEASEAYQTQQEEASEEQRTQQEELQKKAASRVEFERIYEEGLEYAVITGFLDSGEQSWSVTTDSYPAAQLNRVCEVGLKDDRYYYTEGEVLVALNAVDGSEIWRNEELSGAATCSAFDEEGNVYICGYLGPHFFAADKDGSTLAVIRSFSDDYYWPYEIRIQGDTAVVSVEGTPDGSGHGEVIVHLDDFSVELPGDRQETAAGGTDISSMSLEELCEAVGAYYTEQFGNGSAYVVFESECQETDDGYRMLLRYQGGSSANTLVAEVTVHTNTGEVTDSLGGQWSLTEE